MRNPIYKDSNYESNLNNETFKNNVVYREYPFKTILKILSCLVLLIFFGSYALTGFQNSKIIQSEVIDDITIEYQKQVGTEIIGGNFDDFTYDNFGTLTKDKKIYFKKEVPVVDFVTIIPSSRSGNGWFGLRFTTRDLFLYDDTDTLVYSTKYSVNFRIVFKYYLNSYSNTFDYLYFTIYNDDTSRPSIYGCDIIGTEFSRLYQSTRYPTASYFIYSGYYDSNSTITDYTNYDDRISLSANYFTKILNNSLVYGESTEVPIYETTTYTYPIKYYNYDWLNKFNQLKAFRNIFNSRDSFYDEKYYQYSNLKSFVAENVSIFDEYYTSAMLDYYNEDLKIKWLLENGYITFNGKQKQNLFKKNPVYSYIVLVDDSNLDYEDETYKNYLNYVLENYVNENNVDEYYKYIVEKENFDILNVVKFPFMVVGNIGYNFGVLINIIVSW